MPYSNTGPFTNNITPPGISSTFLNNVENFLDTVNTMATDSNNTSDGSGNATVHSMTFAHGKITRIAFGFIASLTNAGQTITHGLGGTPSFVVGQVVAGTGNTGAVVAYFTSIGSSSFVISTNSSSGFPVYWLVIA